jgi:hypothetical protein
VFWGEKEGMLLTPDFLGVRPPKGPTWLGVELPKENDKKMKEV